MIKFKDTDELLCNGTYTGISINGTSITKPYILKGWIGIHSTIDSNLAKENDPNFCKNKFYNPIQIRLYVREKLAVENVINMLNNSQAFVNYIEGEISFDILDDDDFPDIATSNRQSLDENDKRVELLVKILTPILQDLISKRAALSKTVSDSQEELQKRKYTSAKQQFSREVETEVRSFTNLSEMQQSDLTRIITNKMQGDILFKNKYVVFFSHSRHDKPFTEFLYRTLIERGVSVGEIFYTSRDDTPEKYDDLTALSVQIKNNIIDDNVLILYMTSPFYKQSEYCMFEGGAGWATRSVGDYIVLSQEYEDIPKLLTNGKNEFSIMENNNIVLDKERYLYIVKVLNRIIEHINGGRKVNSQELIASFEDVVIPEDFVIHREGKVLTDYMDKSIVDRWNFHIETALPDYLSKYKNKKNPTAT